MADAKDNVRLLFSASYRFVSHLLPLCDHPWCCYPHSTIPRDLSSSHVPLTLIGSDTQLCDHLDHDRACGWVAVTCSSAEYALIDLYSPLQAVVHCLNISNVSFYCVIDNCVVVFTELHGCTETCTWLM